MNVTTTYYSSLHNSQWYTRIGSYGFYSVAKPTARQIRRWKKQVKRFSWPEYKIMVNGHYGKLGKVSLIHGCKLGPSYTYQADILEKLKSITGTAEGMVNYNFPDYDVCSMYRTSVPDAITLGNKIHELANSQAEFIEQYKQDF